MNPFVCTVQETGFFWIGFPEACRASDFRKSDALTATKDRIHADRIFCGVWRVQSARIRSSAAFGESNRRGSGLFARRMETEFVKIRSASSRPFACRSVCRGTRKNRDTAFDAHERHLVNAASQDGPLQDPLHLDAEVDQLP